MCYAFLKHCCLHLFVNRIFIIWLSATILLFSGCSIIGSGDFFRPIWTSVHNLSALPENKDVRVTYRLEPKVGWRNIDRLELVVSGFNVRFIETEKSCDDATCLSFLEGDPKYPKHPIERRSLMEALEREIKIFYGEQNPKRLVIDKRVPENSLPLTNLNRLPNGFIVNIRLRVERAIVVAGDEVIDVIVPKIIKSQGLLLDISAGPAPVCDDFITSIVVNLDADMLLTGDRANPVLLGTPGKRGEKPPSLTGKVTAPVAVRSTKAAKLEVPGELAVSMPARAVDEPKVVRVREIDLGDEDGHNQRPEEYTGARGKFASVDWLFCKSMQRVGKTFDLKPDGFMFQRPVEIALAIPMQSRISEEALDDLLMQGVSEKIIDCLRELNKIFFLDEDQLRDQARLCLKDLIDKLVFRESDIPGLIEQVPPWDPESLALYTWSTAYRLWMPDVPRLHMEHEDMFSEELDRVIAAKQSSDDLEDHFPPDFSHIPTEPYRGLDISHINKKHQDGYLITDSNHFCIKSLYADLNDPTSSADYAPLLDGALDDMNQTADFGFARDDNEDVNCGGDPASAYATRKAVRKTKRIIQEDGVALRLRNNVRNFFEDTTCLALGSATYCYDLDDFVDDVNWAVNVWQEKVNRNPDGGWEDRFLINCTQFYDDDSGCSGDEIDIGIRDIDAPAYNYGRNITIGEDLMQDAMADQEGRLRMRATLLHELGHALGLDHWAGTGTLMSYDGRWRRNTSRYNFCGTYSQAEIGSANYPTALGNRFCRLEDLDNRWGAMYDLTAAIPPAPDYYWARVNRPTCTDTARIRSQINAADIWTSTEPLQCEILAEHTEYAALEIPEYDPVNNEFYYVMDFDLRFAHCGVTASFDRTELEFLGVNADNDSQLVTNLLPVTDNLRTNILRIDPIVQDANGFYTVPVRLETRDLLNATTVTDPTTGITSYPSLSEYIGGQNTLGIDALGNPISLRYQSLAMVIRAFRDTTTGGNRSEFVAGATSLLRSPILMPISAPITLSLTGLTLGGESYYDSPLSETYEDYVTATDFFPYVDNALHKPNVGKVLYVLLPPLGDIDLTDSDENFTATFTWQIPDRQFDSWPGSPARLWVDSIQIFEEDWPTIEDWEEGGSAASNSTSDPIVQYAGDPCTDLSNTFDLMGLGDEAGKREITADNGARIDAWRLYRVNVRYDYIHYHSCANSTDVCAPGAGCSRDPLTGNRSLDFYVSLAGPTGSIVYPPGISSICLLQADVNDANAFPIRADVRGLKALSSHFPDYGFQVRIRGEGKVREWGYFCGRRDPAHAYDGPGWVDVEDLDDDGIHSVPGSWYNNCNDEAYNVELQYRYRTDPTAAWSEPIPLDDLLMRIDNQNDCSRDDVHRFDMTCSPWDEDYECIFE